MSHENKQTVIYVITKHEMEEWFLYTIEHCSYGKRITWTRKLNDALVFPSERRALLFKEKVFENVPIGIRHFLKKL